MIPVHNGMYPMNDDEARELLFRTDEKVEQMEKTMEQRFDSLDSNLESSLTELSGKVEKQDDRMDKLSTRVQRNTSVINYIAAGLGATASAVLSKIVNIAHIW